MAARHVAVQGQATRALQLIKRNDEFFTEDDLHALASAPGLVGLTNSEHLGFFQIFCVYDSPAAAAAHLLDIQTHDHNLSADFHLFPDILLSDSTYWWLQPGAADAPGATSQRQSQGNGAVGQPSTMAISPRAGNTSSNGAPAGYASNRFHLRQASSTRNRHSRCSSTAWI
jgi:hypothetical protein